MPITLTQTDTAADCAAFTACSDISLNGQTSSKLATSGGTAGITAVNLTQDAVAAIRLTIFFQSANNEPDNCSWESGTWTNRLEVTTANMNLNWRGRNVCRLDNACANLATLFNSSIGSTVLDTTGVKTQSWGASAGGSGNATDKIYIIYGIENTTTMTQAWAYKPSQNIDTPVTQNPGNCGAVIKYISMPLMGLGIG